VAREFSGNEPRPPKGKPDPAAVRAYVLDKLDEQAAKQTAKLHAKVQAKAAKHLEKLDRYAQPLDALAVWTRVEPGSRRPRFTRDDIAAAAMRIADAEGFDAVSMRRIAADLDAGTMTLYHYVRTKDELLTLVTDAFMAEVALPVGSTLPAAWRDATTLLACRTRDALRHHPWVLDISDDPQLGPNGVRHFDQSLQALSSLDVPLATKVDIWMAVDEYVFGFCLHERNNAPNVQLDEADGIDDATASVIAYVDELIATGHYPTLRALTDEHTSIGAWRQITAAMGDEQRFERNLARLLDGIERSLPGASRR
jgi:AcrR family transcriptional regulator